MKIGEKRNLLVSQCKGEYIAHMDTDDIYFSTYISYTMSVLEKTKKDAAGTADMVFIFANGKQGGMRNPYLSMANEATLVYNCADQQARTPASVASACTGSALGNTAKRSTTAPKARPLAWPRWSST